MAEIVWKSFPEGTEFPLPHEGYVQESEPGPTQLDSIANIAEVANAVASLIVGHRKILVEGGFDPNMSDAMCQALHAKLLGLGPIWSFDDEDELDESWVDDDDDE